MWLEATRVSTAPGSARLAQHALAGHDGGERSRRRDAQRRHRLADDVFAQHRAERGAAVAPAGKRRRARSLELDVAADAIGVDHLAEQDGAAVAELRHEMSELMAGIGHRDRLGALGKPFSRENLGPFRAVEPVGIEAKLERQRPVQLDQPRRGDRRGRDPGKEIIRQRRIGILEGEMNRHGLNMGISGKIGNRAGRDLGRESGIADPLRPDSDQIPWRDVGVCRRSRCADLHQGTGRRGTGQWLDRVLRGLERWRRLGPKQRPHIYYLLHPRNLRFRRRKRGRR